MTGREAVIFKPEIEDIEVPLDEQDSASGIHKKLDEDGVIKPGEAVDSQSDILISRKLISSFKPGRDFSEVMQKEY